VKEKTMKIRDLMTRDVVTCGVDATLESAADLFWTRDCGSIPVVDSAGRLAGIVTDRDVCLGAFFSGRPMRDLALAQSMCRTVQTCRPDDEVDVALRLMKEHRVRRLPVVDGDGRVEGMVGLADLASAVLSGKSIGGSDTLIAVLAAVTSSVAAKAPVANVTEITPEPRNATRKTEAKPTSSPHAKLAPSAAPKPAPSPTPADAPAAAKSPATSAPTSDAGKQPSAKGGKPNDKRGSKRRP
jgi:CBS domain-containing protein